MVVVTNLGALSPNPMHKEKKPSFEIDNCNIESLNFHFETSMPNLYPATRKNSEYRVIYRKMRQLKKK